MPFDASQPFEVESTAPQAAGFDPSQPLEVESAAPVSALQKAVEPITSLPGEVYKRLSAGGNQMSRGFGQIGEGIRYAASPTPDGHSDAEGLVPLAKGIANVGLGAASSLAAPFDAAYHTIIGKPIEENTGIPHQYTEFAASLLTPGIGMVKAPGMAAKAAAVAAPTVQELRNASTSGYDAIRDANVVVNPDHTKALADAIEKKLTETGYRPVPNTPGANVFRVVDELRNPQSGKTVIGPDLAVAQASTPADIEAVRKALNVAGADPANRGAVGAAKGALDEFYANLPKQDGAVISGDAEGLAGTANAARANYSAAKKSEAVTGAVDRAELNAASSGSGQNIDNATRQRVKALLLDKNQIRSFSPEERAQLARIVRGTFTGNAARYLGNALGGSGGFPQAAASAAGAVVAGPVGAGVAAGLGPALKALGNASTARQVAKLDEMLRSAAPLASDPARVARVRYAADKWARAQTVAERYPTAVSLARLEAAQNGLSLMLNKLGGLDHGSVLNTLQGLTPSTAAPSQPDE